MAKISKILEQLRLKEAAALRKELTDAQVALQKARVDVAFGRLPKTSQIELFRKQVARIQTVLKEKEAVNA